MTILHSVIWWTHPIIGVMIIVLVLLQRGKGAETGAAFGSGASATVFGAKGSANFLSRSTAVLAALFFATALSLAYLGSQRPTTGQSVLEQADTAPAGKSAPGPASGDAAPQTMPQPVIPPAGAPPGGNPAPAGAP
jgi:preprotein translocase subunit SecG